MVRLSIIIVTFNSYSMLDECIGTIYKYNIDKSVYEIVVVDNCPIESCITKIRLKYPDVKYITSNNAGYGVANNIGSENASGDYILFLNY